MDRKSQAKPWMLPCPKGEDEAFRPEKPPDVKRVWTKSHNLIACVFWPCFVQRFLYAEFCWDTCWFCGLAVVCQQPGLYFIQQSTFTLNAFTSLKSNIRNTRMKVWFRWFSFGNGWISGSMLICRECNQPVQYIMGVYGKITMVTTMVGEYFWEHFASASKFAGEFPSFPCFSIQTLVRVDIWKLHDSSAMSFCPWWTPGTPHRVLYGGGNSKIFVCSPRSLGKIPMLTSIFFKGVGSTTN